jgi:hypothetical protein
MITREDDYLWRILQPHSGHIKSVILSAYQHLLERWN